MISPNEFYAWAKTALSLNTPEKSSEMKIRGKYAENAEKRGNGVVNVGLK